MTEPSYLDNHLYVLRGDLIEFKRHFFDMVDDLVFVTRHGMLRNLRTIGRAEPLDTYIWTDADLFRSYRRIAFLALLSAGVVAGLALARVRFDQVEST